MGHFKIDLPAGRKGDVQFGKIIKKSANIIDLFRRRRETRENRTGYIVTVESADGDKKVYRLLRSKEGEWLDKGVEGFKVEKEDSMSAAIKAAIESSQRS